MTCARRPDSLKRVPAAGHPVLLVAFTMLSACVLREGPPNNAEFGTISSLSQLTGSYRNEGSGAGARFPLRLTQVIWPDSGLDHAAITKVRVTAEGADVLRVRAYSDTEQLKEGLFRNGSDFEIESGRLLIKRSCAIMGHRPGDVILGAGCGSVELGLDVAGEGKYERDTVVGGLLAALIPFAATSSEDVRFERLPE